jgi:hypothetical protein
MITRHRFVHAALGAGTLLAAQGCASPPAGAKRMNVDAQIHWWKEPSADWQWMPVRKTTRTG